MNVINMSARRRAVREEDPRNLESALVYLQQEAARMDFREVEHFIGCSILALHEALRRHSN